MLGKVTDLVIEDLRTAVNRILDAAVERFGPVIDVDALRSRVAGFYWHLDVAAAYEVRDDPGLRLSLGDISDSISEIAHFLHPPDGDDEDDKNSVFIWHDLAHAIGLLGLLSYLDLPSVPPDD